MDRRNFLWVDGLAGAIAGVLMLALSGVLASFYDLPQKLLIFNGIVNLIYGSYSINLARRATRSMGWIHFLIAANSFWVLVCFALAAYFYPTANIFGMIHLVGEGLFVGTLAALEWRWRNDLTRS